MRKTSNTSSSRKPTRVGAARKRVRTVEKEEPIAHAIYVLGAGFSRAAGLPLAAELWHEVLIRALKLSGRAEKFRHDLDEYIEFRARCFGDSLTYETVDFEQFLGYLDIEFSLGLRGSETWSREGNEGQVVVKTLIGQILTERTPLANRIPDLYLEFARKLRPSDMVITFNYDTLLEGALDAIDVRYRLFPTRLKSIGSGGAGYVDTDREEVEIFKVHGSVDWFNRQPFIDSIKEAHRQGYYDYIPPDPIFNSDPKRALRQLVDGPRFPDDPLKEIFRVVDIEALYKRPPWFLSTPWLIAPSTAKVVYAERFGEFYRGFKYAGQANFKMVLIGYSLPRHDEYARLVLYHLVDNYQNVPADRVSSFFKEKVPLLMIDLQTTSDGLADLKRRYSFVDWTRAEMHSGGFTDDALKLF